MTSEYPFDDLIEELDVFSSASKEVRTLCSNLKLEIETLHKNIPSFIEDIKNKNFMDDEIKKYLILPDDETSVVSLDEIVIKKLKTDPQTLEIECNWKKLIDPIRTLFKKNIGLTEDKNSILLKMEEKFDELSLEYFNQEYTSHILDQFTKYLQEKHHGEEINIYPPFFKWGM